MELQKSAGEANANITAIRATLDGLNAKLDGYAQLSAHMVSMRSTLDEVKSKTDGQAETSAHMAAMRSTLDGVKSKVDDLVGWKHKILGGAAVLAAVSGLIGFVLAKAGDYVVWRAPTATAPAPSVAAPPAPPAK